MKACIEDSEGNEIEVDLKGSVSKYHPATMYKNNGDPGDPAEGGELEDFSVWLDGKDITETLSADVISRLEEEFRLDFQENEMDDCYDD